MKGTITVAGQQIALTMLRKTLPHLMAQQIVGVQPMNIDTGSFYAPYIPKAPKYKFSRAKWYDADYEWKHQVEVKDWCAENFGPHPKHPDAWSRWYINFDRIRFRDSQDYEWFVLRWS